MLSTTRRGSRDVNKHTEDPVFSLSTKRRKLRAVNQKMVFWSAYISTIAYVNTPCRVETLIDITKSAFKSVHNLRRSSDFYKQFTN